MSYMLVWEDGPFFVFRRLRRRLRANEFGGDTLNAELITQEELDEAMQNSDEPRGLLGELLSCVWCTSVWVAAAWVVATVVWPPFIYAGAVFAVSASAILIESLICRTGRNGVLRADHKTATG